MSNSMVVWNSTIGQKYDGRNILRNDKEKAKGIDTTEKMIDMMFDVSSHEYPINNNATIGGGAHISTPLSDDGDGDKENCDNDDDDDDDDDVNNIKNDGYKMEPFNESTVLNDKEVNTTNHQHYYHHHHHHQQQQKQQLQQQHTSRKHLHYNDDDVDRDGIPDFLSQGEDPEALLRKLQNKLELQRAHRRALERNLGIGGDNNNAKRISHTSERGAGVVVSSSQHDRVSNVPIQLATPPPTSFRWPDEESDSHKDDIINGLDDKGSPPTTPRLPAESDIENRHITPGIKADGTLKSFEEMLEQRLLEEEDVSPSTSSAPVIKHRNFLRKGTKKTYAPPPPSINSSYRRSSLNSEGKRDAKSNSELSVSSSSSRLHKSIELDVEKHIYDPAIFKDESHSLDQSYISDENQSPRCSGESAVVAGVDESALSIDADVVRYLHAPSNERALSTLTGSWISLEEQEDIELKEFQQLENLAAMELESSELTSRIIVESGCDSRNDEELKETIDAPIKPDSKANNQKENDYSSFLKSVEFNDRDVWCSDEEEESVIPTSLKRSTQDVHVQGRVTSAPASRLVRKHFPGVKQEQTKPTIEKASIALDEQVRNEVDSIVSKKVAELEEEIARFKHANLRVTQLVAERESELKRLKTEMSEFERQRAVELERIDEFRITEVKKAAKERKVFERYIKHHKGASNDKKDKERIDGLEAQVAELEAEMRRRDERWQSTQKRYKLRVTELSQLNQELSSEVQRMEMARLGSWAEADDFPSMNSIEPSTPSHGRDEGIRNVASDHVPNSSVSQVDDVALTFPSNVVSVNKTKFSRLPVPKAPVVVTKSVVNEVSNTTTSNSDNAYDGPITDSKVESSDTLPVKKDDVLFSAVSSIAKVTQPQLIRPVHSRRQKDGNCSEFERRLAYNSPAIPSASFGNVAGTRTTSTSQERNAPMPRTLHWEDANAMSESSTTQCQDLEQSQSATGHYNNDETSASRNTKGETERLFPDGTRLILLPNGTRKEVAPDGLVVMYFQNGDVKQTLPSGQRIYYYNEANTTHTTYGDGLEVIHFPNKQVEKRFPDGGMEIRYPDGTVRFVFPTGEEETTMPDGAVQRLTMSGDKIIEFPSGRREIQTVTGDRVIEMPDGQRDMHTTDGTMKRTYPDGSTKVVYADGRQETKYSNGRVRVRDSSGRLVLDTGNPKYSTSANEGSISMSTTGNKVEGSTAKVLT